METEKEKPSDETCAKCRREGIRSSAKRKCIVQNNREYCRTNSVRKQTAVSELDCQQQSQTYQQAGH
jgi:hypothetical protein